MLPLMNSPISSRLINRKIPIIFHEKKRRHFFSSGGGGGRGKGGGSPRSVDILLLLRSLLRLDDTRPKSSHFQASGYAQSILEEFNEATLEPESRGPITAFFPVSPHFLPAQFHFFSVEDLPGLDVW